MSENNLLAIKLHPACLLACTGQRHLPGSRICRSFLIGCFLLFAVQLSIVPPGRHTFQRPGRAGSFQCSRGVVLPLHFQSTSRADSSSPLVFQTYLIHRNPYSCTSFETSRAASDSTTHLIRDRTFWLSSSPLLDPLVRHPCATNPRPRPRSLRPLRPRRPRRTRPAPTTTRPTIRRKVHSLLISATHQTLHPTAGS